MKFSTVRILAFLALALVTGLHAVGQGIPSTTRQMVVVTTASWDAVPGSMQLFERAEEKGKWRAVGRAFPIVVGRNGLGWGSGLHPKTDRPGPGKREGDGKSPAGIFNLSSSFGLEEASKVNWIKLPYRHLTETIECVDDVKSERYNLIVDRADITKPDWDSSEKMKSYTVQYRLGVTVDHNTAPRINGGGSCIFLHIWKAADQGTAGCTAMNDKNIETLLRWLDPAKGPVLVQLPGAEYNALRKPWNLPKLK